MRGIPEATEITLTVEERQQLEALVRSTKCEARMRFRARIVLLAAPGTGDAGDQPSAALHDRHGVEGGGFAMRAIVWRVCRKSAIAAPRRNMVRNIRNASWRCWIDRHLRATPTGRPRCWRANSATFMSSISGVSCEPRRSICPAASPGARAIRHRRSLHDAAGQCCGAVSG